MPHSQLCSPLPRGKLQECINWSSLPHQQGVEQVPPSLCHSSLPPPPCSLTLSAGSKLPLVLKVATMCSGRGACQVEWDPATLRAPSHEPLTPPPYSLSYPSSLLVPGTERNCCGFQQVEDLGAGHASSHVRYAVGSTSLSECRNLGEGIRETSCRPQIILLVRKFRAGNAGNI